MILGKRVLVRETKMGIAEVLLFTKIVEERFDVRVWRRDGAVLIEWMNVDPQDADEKEYPTESYVDSFSEGLMVILEKIKSQQIQG